MARHLVGAAVVLGILQTAMAVVSFGSTVLVAFNELRRPDVGASAWWLVQLVGSAAVRAAWFAVVSYAAVQVCRRMVASSADAAR